MLLTLRCTLRGRVVLLSPEGGTLFEGTLREAALWLDQGGWTWLPGSRGQWALLPRQ